MTPEEKFTFDLEGYLVVKNVLAAAAVDELNGLADEIFPRNYDETNYCRTAPVSRWGARFRDLIDPAALVPYMLELLGPKFRIDHDYCIFMQKGDHRGGLHGGPQGGVFPEADHWYRYHDGTMRNGLTVFTYCLSPARRGDGGFGCIPGTHKSNFVHHIPAEVRNFSRPAHYVSQPEVEAGDVIIFTEALVHGTMPWTAVYERRALLYKYSPGHSAWNQNYYELDDYPGATERQKRIMAPPAVGDRPDSVQPGD